MHPEPCAFLWTIRTLRPTGLWLQERPPQERGAQRNVLTPGDPCSGRGTETSVQTAHTGHELPGMVASHPLHFHEERASGRAWAGRLSGINRGLGERKGGHEGVRMGGWQLCEWTPSGK